jgi:diadenosine tetraphosphate (Ap4A) HIT family hydrolase
MQYDQLDTRLQQDTYFLGYMDGVCLLLSRNAYFPWFILVPDTQETEFYRLPRETQLQLLNLINRLSRFVEKYFSVDKLNVATIGNVVSQMHVHVVGRTIGDPCWPGVVWGCDQFKGYSEGQLKDIREKLETDFADTLQV